MGSRWDARFANTRRVNAALQPGPVLRASFPPRSGNDVRVLIDGEEAFGRIYRLIDEARRSVWITVAFVHLDTALPGRGETFLAAITRAAARGVDVRLLFWWSEYAGIGSCRGDPHEIELLQAHGCSAKMRWDAVPHGCHHQKSYVIDGEVAFVGGINVMAEALSSEAHRGDGFHDLFAEIRGPAVADVACNFVERWNQASVTREQGLAFPDLEIADDLAPVAAVPASGTSTVQIVRTLRKEIYRGGVGWHDSHRFDLADGEDSVRRAVLAAIAAACRSIYVENQFLMDPETITALGLAALRGVEVIAVLPFDPDPNLLLYPAAKLHETRSALASLAEAASVGLFGLVREHEPRCAIYVHAKLVIVDDRVLQIGSANLWPPSYHRDSELNLVVWDPEVAADTRARLWQEHLLGARATSLADWRRLAAHSTAARSNGGNPASRLVAIDPRCYYAFPENTVAPWQAYRDG